MSLMPVADALAAILADAAPLVEEWVPLASAHRRVLARDLAATRTQPPLPMSAMDGYAIRAADAALPGTRLTVIGEVAAGRPAEQRLEAGEAMRIFTGGVVPDGADSVVIQEDTTRDGDAVILNVPSRPGHHIRAAGIDFHQGDVLLRAGTRLSDRDLALAASMNHAKLPLRRRPKIAMLATGDELVMPGTCPAPARSSTPMALRSMRWRVMRAPTLSILASPPIRWNRPPPRSAVPASLMSTFWSPPAGLLPATTTWCCARSRPRAWRCRSGRSRCGPASR